MYFITNNLRFNACLHLDFNNFSSIYSIYLNLAIASYYYAYIENEIKVPSVTIKFPLKRSIIFKYLVQKCMFMHSVW